MPPTESWARAHRLAALRRFAITITVFNVLGHVFFGFEQSWAQPLVALATAYGMELGLEWVDARANRRRPNFLGGPRVLVDFLLSAHITGLAVAMLTYANERLWPVAFAAAVAIASKALLRVPAGTASRHFLNPSNFGISVTLLLFPWVGIAAPYHFTQNLGVIGDWAVPMAIICTGSLVNTWYTRRIPLALAWVGAFALQAIVSSLILWYSTGYCPIAARLSAMTGVAFILFTFYMVTDPATTPERPWAQVAFGASVALVYSLLLMSHVVFALFVALVIVCVARGLGMYLLACVRRPNPTAGSAPVSGPLLPEKAAP